MIVGLGVDLCAIARVERALSRHGGRYEAKVFTERERADCARRARPAHHYAARYAAKEALVKALGGAPGVSWQEIEVASGGASEGGGPPRLLLFGAAAERCRRVGAQRLHLSLSHDGGYAVAVVVAESPGAGLQTAASSDGDEEEQPSALDVREQPPRRPALGADGVTTRPGAVTTSTQEPCR
jgi:holo-[acyl-carrier protein] synthase